jgi:hypothetical protein
MLSESATADETIEDRAAGGEPLSPEREIEVLRAVARLAAERAAAETRTQTEFDEARKANEDTHRSGRETIEARRDAETADAAAEHDAARARFQAGHDDQKSAVLLAYDERRAEIAERYEAESAGAERAADEARWQAKTVFDATKDGPAQALAEFQAKIDGSLVAIRASRDQAQRLLRKWRQGRVADGLPGEGQPGRPDGTSRDQDEPLAVLAECQATAEEHAAQLASLRLPSLFAGITLFWVYLFLWLPIAAACLLATDSVAIGLPVSGAIALAAGTLLGWIMYASARGACQELYPPIALAVRDAEAAHGRALAEMSAACDRQRREIEVRRDRELARIEQVRRARTSEATAERSRASEEAQRVFPQRVAELARQRDRQLAEAHERRLDREAECQRRYAAESAEVEARYRRRKGEVQLKHDEQWDALADAWLHGWGTILGSVAETNKKSARLFPPWPSLAGRSWPPAQVVPPALRFGEFQVRLDQVPDGVAADDRLRAVAPGAIVLPALLPFPARGSLLLKTKGKGRQAAVDALAAVMLRLIASLPPGKVRFTIVDPVGLGENFAAFMHLADHDEALVTSRIWTDPRHIEERLTDLTEHMENVIQKYLRNEFATLEEYNAYAGEIAEPYRFLVLANFPAGISEAAARRLTSIAGSGARCGVFTLVSADLDESPPPGFALRDLEQQATTLVWKRDYFAWKHPEFGPFALALDAPPPPEAMTDILHAAGRHATEAAKVEVPFEFIAPPLDGCWTSDSRHGIDVPLGRAGATRLQHLKLGHGTSQHVLIAGKTGSGKSTLLHALITNTALRYSPDEMELYLVDFKKGVEFKTYAAHELPHARAVAIESDREFGLSVLERLDGELKARADRYRAVGAQDVASFRAATGEKLPRVMLIVDEFQELFVEDDKVAQESALLLDRLVRQGRAFGIHVLLGSQTLGGAYSLARSTIGQMAVRIALQCSEADAHLILSEDNTAARLLSRAGEAIYNDSNGLVEGNHPFQIVWLDDDKREGYLEHVRQLAESRAMADRPRVVFEGNVPAVAAKNVALDRLLRSAAADGPDGGEQTVAPSASAEADRLWLGEAVAIRDPTSALLRPQSGSNVLVVGQNDDAALGIFETGLISLAAQHPLAAGDDPAEGARFYVFDGSPAGSPQAEALARLPGLTRHHVRAVGWRDLAAAIMELALAVDRRQQPGESARAPIYAFVYGLQRFRDLRRQEDDFSFARADSDKPPHPSKQFQAILRDGPPVGVHAIVWCDSLNNLNRTWDRTTLREFELRVLFQMSGNDSTTLIDTPLAAKLGLHRGLFYSEELGRMEKFRPYGPPSAEWLAWVRQRLGGDTAAVAAMGQPPPSPAH